MKIAILGAGNVGATLGKAWAGLGHEIYWALRNKNDAKYAALPGHKYDIKEAIAAAELVLLATPWEQTEAAVKAAGNLSGKILIDATNPLLAPPLRLALGFNHSGAELVASWAQGAKVVKAFNQTGYNIMANPVINGVKTVMFVASDDVHAKKLVMELANHMHFAAYDAGLLHSARYLEPMAMLWIEQAMIHGQGREIGFALLHRKD
jgi:8-hydroxy-5-deazaflavin:NADPH oxidoreductase